MTNKHIQAMLVTMAMVAMASAQTPAYLPFQRPGEILPGIDIRFIIRHAGAMWNQPRALDTLSYACENVLPVISGAIPDNGFPEQYWRPICDRITAAAAQSNPDATALCTGVWSDVEAMIQGGSMAGRRRRQTAMSGMGDDTVAMLFESVVNATKLLYGVDPTDPNIVSDSSLICGVADRFLIPSVPDQVVAFMTELFSGFYLELTKTHYCDNWSDTIQAFGNASDIFMEIGDIGARSAGFADRAAFCAEINNAIATGVTARRALGEQIVRKQIALFTEAAPCKQYTGEVIDVMRRLFPAGSEVNIDAYISGPVLNQYTGFSSIDEICDYIGSSFDSSSGPSGSSAPSMSRLVPALMAIIVMLLSL